MLRRLRSALLVALAVSTLTGCASAGVDLDAARAWAEEISTHDAEIDGMVGAATMQIGPDADTGADDGVRIDLNATVVLDGAVVRCFGGGVASVAITASGTASSAGKRVDVPCDEDPHDVSLPVTEGASIVVSATSNTRTYLHALLRGTPPAAVDEWQHHFDDLAADLGREPGAVPSISWGSFGPADSVSQIGTIDASLPAGDHVVTIECAGPASVTVALTPGDYSGDATPTVEEDLTCPGSGVYPITTDVTGLVVSIDSHGEPGAFLQAIDAAG